MSFDRRTVEKPHPAKYLKRGDGAKTQKFYGEYSIYPANPEPLYGVHPNLQDVQPKYEEVYTDQNQNSFNYLNPRSRTKSNIGGRRRRMKQTKRRRRKQSKRTR